MFWRGFQALLAYLSVVGATSASTDSQGSHAMRTTRRNGFPGEDDTCRSNQGKFEMNIRLISASAAAALGLALSSGAEARTIVVYGAPPVIYAPPPRPVYYTVPVSTYVTVVPAPAPVVLVSAPKPAPTVYVSAPKPAPTVYVPVAGGYAAVPAATVSYAQPVVTVPVAGMH
jgi:hypothetical protein